MSLKAIHLVFITASTVLCFGFAAWAVRDYLSGSGSRLELGYAGGSLVVGVALIIYGNYFLKKLKHTSYL